MPRILLYRTDRQKKVARLCLMDRCAVIVDPSDAKARKRAHDLHTCVSPEWVLDSISHYRLLAFDDYQL